MDSLMELYAYREMLYNLVKKNLRVRYKGSLLGFLWTFINPLLQLLVYSAVFSIILRVQIENYAIYLFVALIPWLFFSTAILDSTSCIIANKDLIKKIYFPRLIIPLSVATTAFMNMLFSMVIVLLALLFSGVGISIYLIFLPIIMLFQFVMVIGACFLFASFNVFFRDLEHILGIVLMSWFYLTPIVYTMEMIPERYLRIYHLNPMTSVVSAYRDILYYKQMPHLDSLFLIFGFSLVALVVGCAVFQKLQRSFAEEL